MPPAPIDTSAPILVIEAFMVLSSVFWFFLGTWFLVWRGTPKTDRLAGAVCLVLAIAFAVPAGMLGLVEQHDGPTGVQEHYLYNLRLTTAATVRESIVVPIPADETLLTHLRVDSGDANWSLVDSAHGRGLYVSFVHFTNLSAEFIEFSQEGKTRDATPTMGNLTTDCVRSAYFFLDGSVDVGVALDIEACGLYATAYPGWSSGEFDCCPPVAVP